jgi:gas vesicle protein
LRRGNLREDLVTESTSIEDQVEHDTTEAKSDVFQRIGRALDEWRAKIDELVVQLDLAHLDLRDEVRKSADATQNAYLAAHSKLSDARGDACSSVQTLQASLEKLLHDLALAFDETQAAVKRTLEN